MCKYVYICNIYSGLFGEPSNCISISNPNLNENFTFSRETLCQTAEENQPDNRCNSNTYSN